ncbi:MAG: hypothetical protein RBQ64_01740 [Candidatus Izemoplasmatales bacterium]|jgi:hypothetical protein|nr:hypothetical protein [Candidatus Izemoplasmatales bacterium]
MKSSQNIVEKLKKVGIKIANKAQETFNTTRNSIEQNFLNDSLRKRFNLENPYKFIIMDSKEKSSILNELLPRYAKRYLEDDIFVFYGTLKDNDIKVDYIIKDLSDETLYKVIELVDVKVTVTYQNKDYEVDGVAVYGKIL